MRKPRPPTGKPTGRPSQTVDQFVGTVEVDESASPLTLGELQRLWALFNPSSPTEEECDEKTA
jgi:hypothetical protein